MGVYLCVISKHKKNISDFIGAKLNELEHALNTDFCSRYMYSSDNGSSVLVDFAVGTRLLGADEEFFACSDGALTVQGKCKYQYRKN